MTLVDILVPQQTVVVALSGVFLPSIAIAEIYQIYLEEVFPLQFLE